MKEKQFDRIIMLFSYKDDNTDRKGYDIVVEDINGYVITDGQKLSDCVCAYGKAFAQLKGYTTFFALDFFYCSRKDIAKKIAEIHNAIRANAGICDIYNGFYSSFDLRSVSNCSI